METMFRKTDESLVEMFANGNNQAFDILLERHKDRVYNYILLIVRNREMAEDIFQETFMRAIMTIKQGRYMENGKFSSWICRIAHNQIIDIYRRERNEKTVSNEEYEEQDLFNDAKLCEENIEDKMVREQVLQDVNNLMLHLPDEQREVVYMRYYQDLSFKEIADITGVSINTALGRMRYAVMNMRRMAQEKDLSLAV
ncbi:MAG: sigma-70 family RNA polymerase sigma factor [Bacteroidales bacterium]|jgi:RNA polymerase sigma-70 factor (ECF subfamily)|nr:sigma-70 family RNA polymerase sigma factor [Bacteroidales bacterium]MBO5819162.1 sigma-70 family RNA polymerase sigma factor [Bacteroidales bacterium]MBO5836222.1 sigma-70 family RNA polymerase sigma factor [Bacteroidales bacterium]MBO5846874.1 sigma-70 family RNA polymerase sigma factor [Bacteroidales bacterium]MBO5916039.1 sigma-70 family RNA polymerase sigma factor [Bacteroidales bacterium]